MKINFCYEGLVKNISSDNITFDGHEPQNLCSKNISVRRKGFISENIVKPPVTVNIEFVRAIQVDSIVIGCCVGAQKSTGIRIAARKRCSNDFIIKNSILESSKKGFIFYKCGKEGPAEFGDSSYQKVPFQKSYLLNKVISLSITIFLIERPSVPVIGKLDIWGSLPPNTPQDIVNFIQEIWEKIIKPPEELKTKICYLRKRKVEDFEVPEEFLDPITNELMTLPIVLPSGKIVDTTTLDRFYEAEAKWGRDKSDPFTGIPFNSEKKPVVCVPLKNKIDKFLLQNCEEEEVKKMPRAVGGDLGAVGPSKLMALEPTKASPSSSVKGILEPSETITVSASLESIISASLNSRSQADRMPPPRLSAPAFSSLDSLISASLAGLPSFTTSQPPAQSSCQKCNSAVNLFKLPCCHIFCRDCLVLLRKWDNSTCTSCSQPFQNQDPVRVHLKSLESQTKVVPENRQLPTLL